MSQPSKDNKNNANNVTNSKETSNTQQDSSKLPLPEVQIENVEDSTNEKITFEKSPPSEDGDDRYRRFTPESYRFLVERDLEAKRKEDEKRNKLEEGRLVDGKLIFGEEEEQVEEDKKEKDNLLIEGNNLPESYLPFPRKLYGVPIEEIDPYIKDKVRKYLILYRLLTLAIVTMYSVLFNPTLLMQIIPNIYFNVG